MERFALIGARTAVGSSPLESSTDAPSLGAPATAAALLPGETAYGVDVALPAGRGAARVVAWYCPQRGEALAELRFLET